MFGRDKDKKRSSLLERRKEFIYMIKQIIL